MGFGQDLLAGLAGAGQGAAQGYGQVQDQRLQQAKLKMQQQAQQQEMEARKRQQVMQARQLLEGGMQVDQQTLGQFAQYPELLAGITKDPNTGMGVVQKTAQQQMIEKQLQDHERESKIRLDQMAARDEAIQMGAEFYNLPIEQRLAYQNRMGDSKFDIMTPAQELENNAKIEQTKLSGQLALAREYARGQSTMGAASIRSNAQQQVSVQDAMNMLMKKQNAWGQPMYDPADPATVQAAQQLAQQLNQQGQQQLAQPGGQPTGQPRWSNLRRVQ